MHLSGQLLTSFNLDAELASPCSQQMIPPLSMINLIGFFDTKMSKHKEVILC